MAEEEPQTRSLDELLTLRTPQDRPLPNEDPPKDPTSWSPIKKWTAVTHLSFIEFLTPLASLMYAASLPQASTALSSPSGALTSFSMTIYVFGFAAGPLLFAPLSDIYGRIWIYRLTMALFLVFTAACGLAKSIGMLVLFRFLAGCVGGAPIALGAAMIKEMFEEENRGRAMSVYFVGPVSGPLLGPILGGFISESLGWRWNFWVVCILSVVSIVPAFILLQETHMPTLIRRQGNGMAGIHQSAALGSVLLSAFSQPFRILFTSFSLFLFFVYLALLVGILNILLSSLSLIYTQQYNFTLSQSGLTHLGMALGSLTGVVLLSFLSDPIHEVLRQRNGGTNEPHHWLPFLLIGGVFCSLGLFLYGWTLSYHIYWLVPLVGLCVFGVGCSTVVVLSNLYLLSVFPSHAASAVAANIVARSIGGAALPLAGTALYQRCGYGWGNTLLAALNMVMWVMPLGIYLSKGKIVKQSSGAGSGIPR